MFIFRKKHDPVVNAILRGVYFKDDPVDLDKGKYENRLQLLKVPQLTKERILRVSPDMAFVNDEVVFTGSTVKQTIGISKDNTLFNRVNLTIVTTGDAVNFWIKVRHNENRKLFITLKTFSSTANDSDVLSFDLPTQLYFNLEYQLTNASDKVEINYTFYFENPIKEAIDTVNANITSLTAIIANINAMNININSLQAIIADIQNIETINLAIAGNVGTMDTNIGNLQAIIADIANIETQNIAIAGDITSLTAIIANIGTMNTYLNNIQAIITDVANIETQNIAIACNVGTMDTNIGNLQAIIADIANIETLNTTISGNITSLTAIIANIGTINTNIGNLQAIITDIANIETQNIAMNTAIATINTNIGTINTAIALIQTTNADIDINIGTVKDLDIDISEQVNKALSFDGTINASAGVLIGTINSAYLYNCMTMLMRNTLNLDLNYTVRLRDTNDYDFLVFTVKDGRVPFYNDYFFPSTKYIKIFIDNDNPNTSLVYNIKFFYTNQTRDNTFLYKGHINDGITNTYYFRDISLLNRISYVCYNPINPVGIVIKVYTRLTANRITYWALLHTENISALTDIVISDVISFTETSDIKITLENKGISNSYYELNLFFSKKLQESEINLANLNEKSYNSLTDKPSIFSAQIGLKFDYFGIGIKGNITTRDYEISVANGDDFDMIGWFVANGEANTPNCIDKFTRNEATSGVVDGDDDAVIVQHNHGITDPKHKHGLPMMFGAGGVEAVRRIWDTNHIVYDDFYTVSVATGISINNAGVSGVSKNIPAKISAIPIIKMS
ncbi:MAG: receptor-binding protein [Asgard archaea virus SkuldV2]|nr:MAG: receptor-binding protein [Asgard archaea virus SkuldV2]